MNPRTALPMLAIATVALAACSAAESPTMPTQPSGTTAASPTTPAQPSGTAASPTELASPGAEPTKNEWWTSADYPAQIGDWEYREVLGQPTYVQGSKRIGVMDTPGPYESLEGYDKRAEEILPGVACIPELVGNPVCNTLLPSGRVITCLNLTDQTPDELARDCREVTAGLPQD